MMNTITQAISGAAGSAARSGCGPMRPGLRAPIGVPLEWPTPPLLEPLASRGVEDHAVSVSPLHRDRLADAPGPVLQLGCGVLDLENAVPVQPDDQGRAASQVHEILELPAEPPPVPGHPQLLGSHRDQHALAR